MQRKIEMQEAEEEEKHGREWLLLRHIECDLSIYPFTLIQCSWDGKIQFCRQVDSFTIDKKEKPRYPFDDLKISTELFRFLNVKYFFFPFKGGLPGVHESSIGSWRAPPLFLWIFFFFFLLVLSYSSTIINQYCKGLTGRTCRIVNNEAVPRWIDVVGMKKRGWKGWRIQVHSFQTIAMNNNFDCAQ
jgi:hypothetical protein